MARDNAAFIKELDIMSPSKDDPLVEGAEQMRVIKTAVKNTFPNLDGPVTATPDDLNYVTKNKFHRGMILMFTGDKAPEHWALCVGGAANGMTIPDLREKFVMGWNPDANIDVETDGGSNTEEDMSSYLTVQEHTLTESQIPAHKHTIIGHMFEGNGGPPIEGPDGIKGGWWKRDNNTTRTDGGGGQGHKHNLAKGKEFDKRPKWYSLAFIVYIGPPIVG